MTANEVLSFWFTELAEAAWFKEDFDLDQEIRDRFFNCYQQAAQGALFGWRKTIDGRLAEILILDQFSRNMFRNKSEAFQSDGMALILSQEASPLKMAKELPAKKRSFLYMPYMHSEALAVHEEAVKLFSEPGLENNLAFELKHKKIIEQFGRFPHRNEILGRISTADEIAFLKTPGSSF